MTSLVTSPWEIAEADFPRAGTTGEQLRFLVNYAILAPSSHNTQPWLFAPADGSLELRADRSRALPVVDPDDRELTMSCGAALFFLRVAARHFGYAGAVSTMPDRGDPELLARFQLGQTIEPTAGDHGLFAAIAKRRTNRTKFNDLPVPRDIIEGMSFAAESEGALLHVVQGHDLREQVAELVMEGDREQLSDKHFRRELAAWVRPNRDRRGDGVPGYAQGVGDIVSLAGPFFLRTFDTGHGQAAKDRELVEGSPLLVVLTTADDAPGAWLAAGQALALVLLMARGSDIWASFLNQPIEIPRLRTKLSKALGIRGNPQLLLRMGYGQEVRATPRRPVEDVIIAN